MLFRSARPFVVPGGTEGASVTSGARSGRQGTPWRSRATSRGGEAARGRRVPARRRHRPDGVARRGRSARKPGADCVRKPRPASPLARAAGRGWFAPGGVLAGESCARRDRRRRAPWFVDALEGGPGHTVRRERLWRLSWWYDEPARCVRSSVVAWRPALVAEVSRMTIGLPRIPVADCSGCLLRVRSFMCRTVC